MPAMQGGIRLQKLPFYPLLIALLFGLASYLGCEPGEIVGPLNQAANSASGQIQFSPTIPARTRDTILVGSFNLQRLGPSKMNNEWVMSRFTEIIRQFDLIALQEITDSSQRALPELVRRVNLNGARYSFVVSPRVGREATGYFEQYAFVFDTDRIAGGEPYCYMVNDEQDLLHREPHVGRFATRTGNPFTFTLINAHTDPSALSTELDDLASLFLQIRNFEYPEDDIILLGDLNERPGRLRGLERIPGLEALIHEPTNTRKNKIFDNFLIDRQLTSEFTGRAGTIDLETMFGISMEEALKISDHLPVWAEFDISENQNRRDPRSAAFGSPQMR
jgi:deoxyribonuclease-1-like protein